MTHKPILYGREQHQHIMHLEMWLKTLIKANPNTAAAINAQSYLDEQSEYHRNFQTWAKRQRDN